MSNDPWSYAKSNDEHSQQVALFMYCNMAYRFGLTAADDPKSYNVKDYAGKLHETKWDHIPQLKWLHAVHNQGHGDAIRGAKAKAEGVKAGVADMFLPVPNKLYHGLYIELKADGGRLAPIQFDFIVDMREAGYQADMAVGWLEARKLILEYLLLPLDV